MDIVPMGRPQESPCLDGGLGDSRAFLLHDPFYYNYVYNSPHTEPMKDEE